MEFDTLVEFFTFLKYAKRRYPMIVTYVKYLNKIKNDEDKNIEIEHFKKFLIDNQCLTNKELTSLFFKTGKTSLTLAMDNFINIPIEESESFWDEILKVERVIFPNGKPTHMESPTGSAGFTGAIAAFQNNPLMSDVIEQVKNMGDLDITDVNSLMEKPGFQQIVNNIKSNLQSGKYSIKDLTGTVSDVIKGVQHELDDETKNTLKVVTDTMDAVERNEPVDMNNLMNIVSNLKLDTR
jgi:hypothetical protein